MENRTADITRLNFTTCILDAKTYINDGDFVYMDGRSLKIVPIETICIYETQESLREKLHEFLNTAGRTSLAKRSLEKKIITYQTVKLLESQINKPRTRQTLLNNIPQQFFTPMKLLPDLVKNDMEGKGMTEIPSNIFSFHRLATCKSSGMHSLPLIKYITTQCMEIDLNSSFESLEGEFEECAETILSEHHKETLQNTMDCITTLNIFRDIWNQQNSSRWNKISLQPEAQPCLNNPPENILLDYRTKDTSKSKKSRAKKKATKGELTQTTIPKKPAHTPTVTPSSEPSTSGQNTPIAEKATEHFPSQIDKTPSKVEPIPEKKPKAESILPKTILPKQTSSISSQGARPKEAVSSLSSQGSRPEEVSTPSPESIISSQDGITITDQQELDALLVKICLEVRKEYVEKEADIQRYIDDPNDKNLLKEAKAAFRRGLWPPGRLHDLLTNAYSASGEVFFLNKRDYYVQKGSFIWGHSPKKEKETYINTLPRCLNNVLSNRFHYSIKDGITPAETIDRCFKNFFIADTGIIINLVLARTLKHWWGDKTYNKYFETHKPLQLFSFGAQMLGSHIDLFTKKTIYKNFKDIRYVEGGIYPFLNHRDYTMQDITGEYPGLFAFCTDAQTPLFCVPELFEDANIPTIHKKLLELFNKKPYHEKIMSEESWNILITAFHLYVSKKRLDNKVTFTSEKDISHYNASLHNHYSYRLDFIETNKKKQFYNKKVQTDDTKEANKKNPNKKINPNTKEATPVAASPSFLPETSTTEKTFKPDPKQTLEKHQSNVNKAIRKHKTHEATREEAMKAFLLLKDFYLTLKTEDPALYKEHEHIYKKIEDKVRMIQEQQDL